MAPRVSVSLNFKINFFSHFAKEPSLFHSLFPFYFLTLFLFAFRSSFLAEIEKCIEEPERIGILFKRYERRLNMYIVPNESIGYLTS